MWRRSIRARMTAGFVLVMLPLLIMVFGVLTGASIRKQDAMAGQALQLVVDRAAKRLEEPNRSAALLDLARDPEMRARRISILLFDPQGQLTGHSGGEVPPWPWDTLLHDPRLLEDLVRASNAPTIGVPWEDGDQESARADVSPSITPTFGMPWENVHDVRPNGRLPAAMSWNGFGRASVSKVDDPDAALVERLLWRAKTRWRAVMAHTGDRYTVIAATPRAELGPQMRQHAAAGGLILLGVAAGAWLLVGCVLSPIRHLADQADTVSSQDLQVRLKAPSADAEVVHLVGTLNGLLGRLAQTAAVRGRFYAAASHELRTPLQALSGHLEVALSRDRPATEYREALNEAYRQTRRLTRLTTDLLLLNRLEGAQPEQKEVVDLRDIVESSLRQHQREIEDRRLRCIADLDETIRLSAPPTPHQNLVRNVVENAVKYSSAGGDLRVSLVPGAKPRLEIQNDCAWNPSLEGDRWLEPFYRPDASRTSGTGGNGLGLAICRAIAQANGWRLSLEPVEHGVRVVVHFDAPIEDRGGR